MTPERNIAIGALTSGAVMGGLLMIGLAGPSQPPSTPVVTVTEVEKPAPRRDTIEPFVYEVEPTRLGAMSCYLCVVRLPSGERIAITTGWSNSSPTVTVLSKP